MQRSPIFVIGHPKSGTSLLTALLDSHPELLVLSEESDFYLNVWPKAEVLNWEWKLSKEEKTNALLEHITTISHIKNYFRGAIENDISGNFDYSHFNHTLFKEKLKAFIDSQTKFERRSLFLGILEAYGECLKSESLEKKTHWVEKTAKNTWYIHSILEDHPTSKFVFIYRDPRDNFISFKKKLGEKLTAIKFAKSWNDSFEQAKQIDPSQIIYIKYEELISQPEVHLKKIAEHLGIQYANELLTPSKLGVPWKGNSMFGSKSKGFRSDSIGRYKNIITSEELDILEAFCSEHMTECGYTLDKDGSAFKNVRSKFQAEYDAFYPFGIHTPPTARKFLGKMRIKLTGKAKK